MNGIEVKCYFCNKKFIKSIGRVNEAKKFGWKFYCGPTCQHKNRNKQKIFKCSNPNCNNIFSRAPNDARTQNLFCSHSCAAIFHNERRKIHKICPICNKNFIGWRKYCSKNCYIKTANSDRKIPTGIYKQKIISRICNFYNKNGRVPVKKEMYGLYRTARKLFGTWNNAIKAAGFEPNPVMFSRIHVAKDGHRCDSLTEKIIDDWLFKNKIEHERNVFYPNSRYTADFKINNKFVEFFGLKGELKSYDKNLEIKEEIARKNNIELIGIYPKDLFPKNNLSKIIKI